MPQASEKTRYIVRAAGDSTPLQQFIAGIHSDPAIRLVDTIGPAQQPHTAVIETDEPTAEQLAQRFRSTNQLIIEPDRPLSLFGQGR